MRIKSYFTFTFILMLMFDDTDDLPGDRLLLEDALENLSHWKVVPFINRSITELERMAQLKGLMLPAVGSTF